MIPLTTGDRNTLLSLARLVLQVSVKTGRRPEMELRSPGVCQTAGILVELQVLGQPRGKAALLHSATPLYQNVMTCTWRAAVEEEGRLPVSAQELPQTRIRITVLADPEPVTGPESIDPSVHGLAVPSADLVLLPGTVRDAGWSSLQFLAEACREAGHPPDAWPTHLEIFRFHPDSFAEAGFSDER